jgi:site-specific DNA-methyltransferase (adenine-specific)
MNEEFINKLVVGDVLEILPQIEDSSIDLVLTDPPYFLHKMDSNWNPRVVSSITDYCHVVKSLPPGMKFDKEQGKNLYEWFLKVAKEILRVLKPGGFFFSFSSPRLYHRMVCAAEDAGFLIRDCFIWLYTQSQPKAMSLNHFIDRMDIGRDARAELKRQLSGWKTPQLKSCFEPIMMAQKECEETFLNNMLRYNTGLINTNIKIGRGTFPANVITTEEINEVLDRYFLLPKPDKEEKGEFNTHKTVKPLAICEHIIKLTTFSEQAVVLDPFVGSGTTAVAAKRLGRKFIGIDINREYIEIARRRLEGIRVKKQTSGKTQEIQVALF